MVYMDGDNNLEDAAINDFMEISSVGEVGLDSGVSEVVVLLDRAPAAIAGAGDTTTYGDWEDCLGFYVDKNDTPHNSTADTTFGEANMGDSTTLTRFINWATSTRPAKRYALVLWNHGGGWRARIEELEERLRVQPLTPDEQDEIRAEIRTLEEKIREREGIPRAVCWDYTDDEDPLYTKEVRLALEAADTTIDLIGFDACLMAMLEVAHELALSDSPPSVMVGSEESEGIDGWPYDAILTELIVNGTTISDTVLGDTIVIEYGQQSDLGAYNTQSAIDLSKIADLDSALDVFVDTAIAQLTVSQDTPISEARDSAPYYSHTYYRDLGLFMQGVVDYSSNDSVVTAATNVVTELKEAVISSTGLHADSGLSIYFPSTSIDSAYTSDNIKFAGETKWKTFLEAFLGSSSADTTTSSSSTSEEDEGKVEKKCFVATAAYGTPLAEEVEVLCQFRDEYLLTNGPGRILVKTYNYFSPPLARFISQRTLLQKAVRLQLRPWVWISKKLVSDK